MLAFLGSNDGDDQRHGNRGRHRDAQRDDARRRQVSDPGDVRADARRGARVGREPRLPGERRVPAREQAADRIADKDDPAPPRLALVVHHRAPRARELLPQLERREAVAAAKREAAAAAHEALLDEALRKMRTVDYLDGSS